MEQIKPKQCVCLATGKKISCSQCEQPIIDQDYKERGCNMAPMIIGTTLKRKENKFKQQQKEFRKREPIERIRCGCGNTIRLFNKKTEVKCFRCNSFWEKKEGKWCKEVIEVKRDVMTFADLKIMVRRRKVPVMAKR